MSTSLTGKKQIDLALVGLSLLATLGALGVIIYTQMIYKKPLPSDILERVKMIEESRKAVFPEGYKLDKLIINLKSRRSKLRYLDVVIHFVPFHPKFNDDLETNKALINDAVIDIAGSMEPSELNSSMGKILFETRVRKRVNKIIRKKAVKELYFSRFVIQ
ncbi:MAG: flagellar basal body-associated FliL family protein [Bacteriovoracaceae bacterium]|nr:flagellar basal body-associated FliL family protein [Bacteriovoracaceae bacterium]